MMLKSSFVIVFHYEDDIEVSLFTGGRMLIKNVNDEKAALTVRREISKVLGLKTAA
jgi:hypothetical protein